MSSHELFASMFTHDVMASTSNLATMETSTSEPVLEGNYSHLQGIMLYTYAISGSLGMVGNGLVILVILSLPKLRKKLTNILITHQCIIDFLVSVVLLALTDTQRQYHIPGLAGMILCKVWLSTYILWVLMTVSTNNLCLLSLEKYFAIVHPIWHKTAFTRSKAIAGMVAVWVCGIVLNLFILVTTTLQGTTCFRLWVWMSDFARRATGVTNCFLKFLIPISIMVYSYGRILSVINSKVAPSSSVHGGQPSSSLRYINARRKTVKMLILVVACFFLCWVWNQVFFLAFNLGAPLQLSSSFYQFSVIAVYFNSCINPFIFIFKYGEFKNGLRELVGRVVPSLADSETVDSNATDQTNTHAVP